MGIFQWFESGGEIEQKNVGYMRSEERNGKAREL